MTVGAAPRGRRIAAAAVAVALLTAAWVRVAAIEPSLRIRKYRAAHNDVFDEFNVFVESHGGEMLDEVSIEPVSGPVTFTGGTSMKNLPAQWRVTFVVRMPSPGSPKGVVRIVQKGSASRTYDVELGGAE